jgi:hypothetical protein
MMVRSLPTNWRQHGEQNNLLLPHVGCGRFILDIFGVLKMEKKKKKTSLKDQRPS